MLLLCIACKVRMSIENTKSLDLTHQDIRFLLVFHIAEGFCCALHVRCFHSPDYSNVNTWEEVTVHGKTLESSSSTLLSFHISSQCLHLKCLPLSDLTETYYLVSTSAYYGFVSGKDGEFVWWPALMG
eukprot:c41073_g1_i1 orf=19-402(+)